MNNAEPSSSPPWLTAPTSTGSNELTTNGVVVRRLPGVLPLTPEQKLSVGTAVLVLVAWTAVLTVTADRFMVRRAL